LEEKNMSEIYNPEDIKNEFIKNTISEYTKLYSAQQIDLAVYYLTDFVNNLVANDLLIVKLDEPEQQPAPQPQAVYQQPRGPNPNAASYAPPVPPQQSMYSQNPFQEEEYRDPRTQRMRVDDVRVKQEVAEMNEQLRNPAPRRVVAESKQEVSLTSEKGKTFVDKIKDMRNPRKKDNINPDE
jgi:type IV secretory pathway VirB10-like protein